MIKKKINKKLKRIVNKRSQRRQTKMNIGKNTDIKLGIKRERERKSKTKQHAPLPLCTNIHNQRQINLAQLCRRNQFYTKLIPLPVCK